MKALTVYGPYNARYEDVPTPEAKGRYMTVKVEAAGLCATDISIWTGKSSFITDGLIKYPCRFGHEWSGTVVAVGEDVKGFKVGDRVYSDSGIACGVCPDCLAGHYEKCQHSRSVGTVNCWDGCFAEYMSIPDFNAYHIPDGVSFEEAALIEPLGISVDAYHNVELTQEDTVVVIGTGAIGMGAVWLAKYLGAGRIISIGRTDAKLAVAKELGADVLINARNTDPVKAIRDMTGGAGASFIVETSGNYDALLQSISMAAVDGRIATISFYEKKVDQFPIDQLVLNRISIVGCAGRFGNPEKVAKILAENPQKPTAIISHRVPYDGMLDTLKNLDKYNSTRIKIMIGYK